MYRCVFIGASTARRMTATTIASQSLPEVLAWCSRYSQRWRYGRTRSLASTKRSSGIGGASFVPHRENEEQLDARDDASNDDADYDGAHGLFFFRRTKATIAAMAPKQSSQGKQTITIAMARATLILHLLSLHTMTDDYGKNSGSNEKNGNAQSHNASREEPNAKSPSTEH